MIDTDKYEGHSTEYTYEIVSVDDGKELIATYALLNDAPLLLEEVKRLREQVECSKGEHEWELDDYLDGDPNEPVRIVETCAACGLVRERIE